MLQSYKSTEVPLPLKHICASCVMFIGNNSKGESKEKWVNDAAGTASEVFCSPRREAEYHPQDTPKEKHTETHINETIKN